MPNELIVRKWECNFCGAQFEREEEAERDEVSCEKLVERWIRLKRSVVILEPKSLCSSFPFREFFTFAIVVINNVVMKKSRFSPRGSRRDYEIVLSYFPLIQLEADEPVREKELNFFGTAEFLLARLDEFERGMPIRGYCSERSVRLMTEEERDSMGTIIQKLRDSLFLAETSLDLSVMPEVEESPGEPHLVAGVEDQPSDEEAVEEIADDSAEEKKEECG
ncbi:hypothetical protein KKC32_00885 [Patescibacteria group bacterium]|nr:hypothetical protein [Patescibacteria group bacterium]